MRQRNAKFRFKETQEMVSQKACKLRVSGKIINETKRSTRIQIEKYLLNFSITLGKAFSEE